MAIKLAYIVARFPSVSQTFILREIIELSKQGIEIDIFPLKSKPDKIIHNDAKQVLNRAHYISLFSVKFFLAQIYFLFKSPLKYLSLFYFIFKKNFRNPYALTVSLGLIPLAAYISIVIKRKKICHIHAHMATFQATCAMLVSMLTDLPFSFTAHATDIRGDQAERTHRNTNMLQEKMERTKFVVTCTNDNMLYLRKHHVNISPSKFILNYHGIDAEKFLPNRCEESPPVILAVGRLLPCKGFEYLIESCNVLSEKKIQFNCLIVGDGPDKDNLEKLINDMMLNEKVKLLGAKSQEDLINLYNRASIFVLPSVTESHFGIPNTLFEAMSMMVPVVVSELPAVKELISSKSEGFVVPEKKVNDLVSAIEFLLGDADLRKTIGINGRKKIINCFDVKDKVNELKEIFESYL